MSKIISYHLKDKVEITDIEKFNQFIDDKSAYRYKMIYERLVKSNLNLSDEHLHDFYRYDIRIRRLLFKYLTAYEIKLRGRVLNNITTGYLKVERMDFGKLIDRYYENDINLVNVKTIRNYVMHHRMIQLMPLDKVLLGINTMLQKLDSGKFIIELMSLSKDLMLIYEFYHIKGEIKYGMGK